MTHQPLTKAERDELRRLHEDDGLRWNAEKGCVSGWSDDPESDPTDGRDHYLPRGFNVFMGEQSDLAAAARNALPRLLDDMDAAEALHNSVMVDLAACVIRADRAEAKVYELKSRICKLDCRYTMGDVADISGSHCTEPCARCQADRDRMEAEAERDALKAKLAESKASELLTRSRAEEAHSIVAALSMRPDLCHTPDCEVQKLRAWAPGQNLPACNCGAWELQGRIEAIAAARGGAQ